MDVGDIKITKQNNTSSCGACHEANKDKSAKIEFMLQFTRRPLIGREHRKNYKMTFEHDRKGELKVTMYDVENKTNIDVKILNNETVKQNINKKFNDIIKKFAKDTGKCVQSGIIKCSKGIIENDQGGFFKSGIIKGCSEIIKGSKGIIEDNEDHFSIGGIIKGGSKSEKYDDLKDSILAIVENNFFVDNLRKLKLSDNLIKDIVPEPFLDYYNATYEQDKIIKKYDFYDSGIIIIKGSNRKKNDKNKNKANTVIHQKGMIKDVSSEGGEDKDNVKNSKNEEADNNNISNNSNVDDKNDNKKAILKDFSNVDVNSSIKLGGKNHLLKYELLKIRKELDVKQGKNNSKIKNNNLHYKRVKYGNHGWVKSK